MSYRSANIVQTLDRLATAYGRPRRTRLDDGPEFISKDLAMWAETRSVMLDVSRLGKLTDNAFAEPSDDRVRSRRLNAF